MSEQQRTDAEWRAADRRKRINDLAAVYAGHLASGAHFGGESDAEIAETCDTMVRMARALAAAVVDAEEQK